MFKSLLLSFTMLLAAMLGGCQTYYGFAKYVSDDRLDGKNVLMSHPSPLVSLPTLLGDVVGVVVALPLEIPASFIAGGYNAVKDRTDDAKYAKELNETEHEKYVRLAPAIVLEAVGQHALGVPAWMMFGWWWPKDLIVIPRPAQDTKVAATSPKASEAFRADAPLPAASAPDQPVMAYGGGYVGALAFSPDGKTCAIGRGKYLLLIDAASGRCLRVLGGHEGMVAGAVFSNDGSKIATSAFDTADEDQVTSYSKNRKLDFTARLWNVSDGRCLRVFAGHTKSVVGLAISADGSRIVTGSDDSSAKLWDAENGKCLLTLTGHEHGIGSVAIAPDGNTILTGSGDHTARLWDAKSGRCLQVLTGHEGPIYSVAFSPDGQRVLTGSPDRTARVWDTRTGKELFKLNCGSLFKSRIRTGTDDFFGPLPTTDMVLSVAFTLDGASILTGISSGTSIVWSAADGKRLREIKSKIEENVAQRKSPGVCRTVVFSRDGSKIMTGALDGLVRLWDAQTEKCIQIFGGHGDNEIRAMALSPDGKTLATGSYFCTTCLWNIADGRCTKSLKFMDRGPGWEVGGVAFSPGGARIFTACNDGYFRIWQVSDGKQLGRFRGAGGNGYRSAAGTADGKLAVVGDGNQTAHLIDLEQEKLIRSFAPEGRQSGPDMRVAISSDHSRVLSSSSTNSKDWVKLWNAETGACEKSFDLGAAATSDVGFSADGTMFFTGWDGTKARLWRTRNGELVREFEISGVTQNPNRYKYAMSSLALSPDGKLAAAGLTDGQIWIWRVADGQCIRVLHGHKKKVTFISFTQDGSKFLTASEDKLILLWETTP